MRVRFRKMSTLPEALLEEDRTGTVSHVYIREPLPLYNIYADDTNTPISVWHDEIFEVLP
jgi:hypothetical protein